MDYKKLDKTWTELIPILRRGAQPRPGTHIKECLLGYTRKGDIPYHLLIDH